MPKEHWLDVAGVGHIDSVESWQQSVLSIKATGRGSCQRTCLNKYGFPRGYLTLSKAAFGFQTGDMLRTVVTTGKNVGTYLGRLAIRASGRFNIRTANGLVQGIHPRFCSRVYRTDGYSHQWQPI